MTTRRGNGEGTIVLRADGRWSATISITDETGKRKRKAFYGKTRPEVVAKLNAALRDREAGLPVDPERVSLGAYLERWLEESVRPSVRPKTYDDYRFLTRKHIIPALGHVQLQKLSPQQVQAFLNGKSQAGLSPRSVQYLRAVLRRALGNAVRWGLVPRNVATLVEVPKLAQPEISPLTIEEARRLLGSVRGDRWEALLLTTLALGLRRGEVLALRWEDVDLDGGRLTVQGSIQRVGGRLQRLDPKTKASRRTVVLPRSVAAALKGHRSRQLEERLKAGPRWQESGLVFTTSLGTAIEPRNLNRAFTAALKRAGLRSVRFHDLRHTACSLLLAQGVPVKAVSELLGHSDVGLTLRVYTHTFDEERRLAADQMDLLMAVGQD